MEPHKCEIAACVTSASTSKSDTSERTVVFPDPIDPEIISTGTVALTSILFLLPTLRWFRPPLLNRRSAPIEVC